MPGYLYTRRFCVLLDDINRMAQLEYDCEAGVYHVTGGGGYTLRVF